MKAYFISDLNIDEWIPPRDGFTNLGPFRKLLNKWLCPADIVFVAGNIGSDINNIYSVFAVLMENYGKIIYVTGNYEYRLTPDEKMRCMDTYKKLDKTNHFIDNLTKNYKTGIQLAQQINGNYTKINALTISGSMGYSDFSYAITKENKNIDEYVENWPKTCDGKTWKLNWSTDAKEIAKYENDKLINSIIPEETDILVSHYGPWQGINISQKSVDYDYGYLTIDGKPIFDRLKDGAIWHFGHVHDKVKREVQTKNGNILLLNNAIGCPGEIKSGLVKEDFILDI